MDIYIRTSLEAWQASRSAFASSQPVQELIANAVETAPATAESMTPAQVENLGGHAVAGTQANAQ
jgi:hypothetical protein